MGVERIKNRMGHSDNFNLRPKSLTHLAKHINTRAPTPILHLADGRVGQPTLLTKLGCRQSLRLAEFAQAVADSFSVKLILHTHTPQALHIE